MFQLSDSFLINIQTLKQSIKTSLEWMTFILQLFWPQTTREFQI